MMKDSLNIRPAMLLLILLMIWCGVLAADSYGQEIAAETAARLSAYENHWCYAYLKDLVGQGLVNGDEKGNYNVEDNMSIGEFLTVLSQIEPTIAEEPGTVNERETLSWQARTSQWAIARGIADPALLAEFDRPIVRGEAAVLIAAYLGLEQKQDDLEPYSHLIRDYLDMDEGVREAALICYREGILSGDHGGNLRAADTLKRSEAFVLISKVLHPQQRVPAVLIPVFYAIAVPDTIQQQMRGVTYHETARVTLADLRYLKMSYVGFDGAEHVGEMIVHRLVATEVLEIFQELFANRYPIEKMVLPDVYGGSDERSMQDNNTSGFNDRTIANSSSVSNHQLGLAIDINPLYNPYYNEKTKLLQPETAGPYVNRSTGEPAYIQKNDLCYNAFVSRGWTWGGDWSNPKDYQHFERVVSWQ